METFTQPKITGYRQLSEAEGKLMSDMKAGLGSTCQLYLQIAKDHVGAQRGMASNMAGSAMTVEAHTSAKAEIARIDAAQPERWIAIANTHFQEGLMALTRAVAQPSSF